MAFKHVKNKPLILTEMIIYGVFLAWFLYKMVPIGLM